jgi:hypothetical protein
LDWSVGHARRQYDVVDPSNRLVAGEPERRWNETLQAVAKIEVNYRHDRAASAAAW